MVGLAEGADQARAGTRWRPPRACTALWTTSARLGNNSRPQLHDRMHVTAPGRADPPVVISGKPEHQTLETGRFGPFCISGTVYRWGSPPVPIRNFLVPQVALVARRPFFNQAKAKVGARRDFRQCLQPCVRVPAEPRSRVARELLGKSSAGRGRLFRTPDIRPSRKSLTGEKSPGRRLPGDGGRMARLHNPRIVNNVC